MGVQCYISVVPCAMSFQCLLKPLQMTVARVSDLKPLRLMFDQVQAPKLVQGQRKILVWVKIIIRPRLRDLPCYEIKSTWERIAVMETGSCLLCQSMTFFSPSIHPDLLPLWTWSWTWYSSITMSHYFLFCSQKTRVIIQLLEVFVTLNVKHVSLLGFC